MKQKITKKNTPATHFPPYKNIANENIRNREIQEMYTRKNNNNNINMIIIKKRYDIKLHTCHPLNSSHTPQHFTQ